MAKKYQPAEFEKKWLEQWEKDGVYKTPTLKSNVKGQRSKVYVLDMFPYPSAAGLHVGHPRGYTASDILSRFYRMNGRAVLHPMGWDAFGLPAENAAIKAKKNPIDTVPGNIANFKRQMKMLGFSYDWEKEFATTDPEYYKWTQWLFIQFFKMGLLYKKNTPINFCPVCKTGLAEEEVLSDGTHERCGNKIEKKELPQWIFKITKYADRLLADLQGLDWPKGILEMQKNWIGKKEGINIKYQITNTNFQIDCFTTRPDTNFGATFIVLAPEHPFVKQILNPKSEILNKIQIQNSKIKEIDNYVKKAQSKSELERIAEGREKTGVFTGFYAINNLNGRKMPIWISDFVLMSVGTGAVVGVPGHDIRDYEFAMEFGLDIVRVVVGKDGDKSPITRKNQVYEEEPAFVKTSAGKAGTMVNSEFLNGLNIHTATKKIMDYLEEKGWGKRTVSYHLRDWIFSRQRYWGEPIPMINCEKCSWQPVPEEELPLKLPYIKSYQPTDTGESPLAKVESFVKTTCPKCGGPARRETDTMPNWAGSCWYFIRFAQNQKSKIKNQNLKQQWLASRSLGEDWQPVDWYLGGAEHAVLHLLYARFWVKALYDFKLINFKEPFLRLRNVGMVLAEDHRKMSKSYGNVINPDDVVAEFGADSLRLYEMFMAPFSQEISWSTKTLQGVYRFLKRIWEIYYSQYQKLNIKNAPFAKASEDKQNDKLKIKNNQLINKLNKTINKVTSDIENIKMNTAIAAMMEFLNEWEKNVERLTLDVEQGKRFLKLLAPFAPFITEEIWRTVFAEKTSIHLSSWPKVEGEIVEEEVTIPVQVNGKLRETLNVQHSTLNNKEELIRMALKSEKIQKYLSGQKYKTIYVPGKILNFVII